VCTGARCGGHLRVVITVKVLTRAAPLALCCGAPPLQCDTHTCYPDQPLSLVLTNPNGPLPTTFVGAITLVIPAAQSSGVFNFILWGEDSNSQFYDFSGSLNLEATCNTDADCPPGSYCKSGAEYFPPYTCEDK
jgi:hypothetical protein